MKSGRPAIAVLLAARVFSALAVSTLPVSTLAASAEKRGLTSEDYFAFQNIGDAHLAPDGKQLACVLTTLDQKRNRRDNSIWVVAVAAGSTADGKPAPRRLTAEGVNSTSPRWS